MTTTAHDRDVNKPRPCSRRTRWRPFWRCWQTVSIWTYFDCELAIFVCISKLNYPGYIPHVFVVVVSLQARKNVEFQTAVSRFLHSSFSELRLKKQNDLLYKSNVVPDYFLLVEDFPILVKFIHRSYSHYASFCGNLIHALFPAEAKLCEILKKRQQNKLTETCKRLCLPNKCLWRQNVCYIKQVLQSSGFITLHTLGLASRRPRLCGCKR